MLRSLCFLLLLSPLLLGREVLPLMGEWQFSLNSKAADGEKDWQTVTLPHDWSWEIGPQKNGAQKDKGGYRVGGVGHYRKEFELPASFAGQRVSIHFDGVYRNSTVSINGKKLGTRPYGYIPFYYNLSNHLREGSNTIEVHVDCSKEPSTRWYHPLRHLRPRQTHRNQSRALLHPRHHFRHHS